MNQRQEITQKNGSKKMLNPSLGRLLIVDDEAKLMAVLRELLTKHGYDAVGFTSGKEALEDLKTQKFDLLLTDLMMPEMDGIALLRASLEIDPNLMAIMMTAQGTIETAVEAMKIGAFDYVLKPFQMSFLMPVLSKAMGVRRLKLGNAQLRETVSSYELGKAIAFTLDLDEILKRVADAALQQCGADEVCVMLLTRPGDELYVALVRGGNGEYSIGQCVPIAQGIANWLGPCHKPLLINDLCNVPTFAPVNPGDHICSAISMPMLTGGKLVGVINVNSTKRRRSFTLGETKALSILASMAASALENVRLFGKVREAEEKYRSIFENAVGGIYQMKPGKGFITANPALAHMLGYESPRQLLERVTDIEHQIYVDPKRYAEIERLLEKQGQIQGVEYQVRRKDGSVIWVSDSARTVRDGNGAILCYEGTFEDITLRKEAEEKVHESLEKLQRTLDGTVFALASTAEKRDPYAAGHQQRVAQLACAISREMGLSESQIEGIRVAGILHDIGKIYIPAEILSKPGSITEIEFQMIKTHPQVGYDILKDIEFPWPVAQITLQLHERMDGSGYPGGLSGEEILLEARILGVADMVETMASHRDYLPALGIGKALEEISAKKGTSYDSGVVDACLTLFQKRGFKFE
ncbi:MAG: HD domain-containing phosphohydrolase [Syntrophales bacterium]